MNKYIGQIIEDRWKVVSYQNKIYELINIYNNYAVKIQSSVFYRIIKNQTTISKVISYRLNKHKIGFRYGLKKISNRIY